MSKPPVLRQIQATTAGADAESGMIKIFSAEMFLERGWTFTHETIRDWETRFAPLLTDQLWRKRHGQAGSSWYVDETYIKVHGKWCYLYRAIDHDGNLLDSRLSERRDMEAARQFFRQAVTIVGHVPKQVTTDGHASTHGLYVRRWVVMCSIEPINTSMIG
jgi:transposase-like protein